MKDTTRAAAHGLITAVGLFALVGCTSAPTAPGASSAPTVTEALSAANVNEILDISNPDVAPVADSEWPAQQDGYEFSTEPQGQAEEWIVRHYPQQWIEGVRAMTTAIRTSDGTQVVPGSLVRYVDGARYDGDAESPLAFQHPNSRPDVAPLDIYELKTTGAQWPEDADWSSYYSVSVVASSGGERADHNGVTRSVPSSTKIRVAVHTEEGWVDAPYGGDASLSFASVDEALNYMQANGILTSTGRTLYPGEIGSLMTTEDGEELESFMVNPNTWESVPYVPNLD
ncbi:hypothetical protein [Demequina sp. NBRC 110051]|uniref:hypothetical protein n=1 Tax=Demequina sp. NBRC 110051 TaxID=1570340 RepID=UPI0009FD9902|nr:hypothetical protein [Demequina sp. NBRC 110051]